MSKKDVHTKRSIVTMHVVASLDGYIARHDNDVSWLESPGNVYKAGVTLDSTEVEKVLSSIGCYVMGSHTYEHALELGWPYGDTPTIVLTSRELPSTRESVEFYSGDLERLLTEVLTPRYKSIWLVGGAQLCQSLLELGLVDKIILTIAPVTLGDGLRLFGTSGPEQRWQLKDVAAYRNGFVELTYEISPREA
ncbi:MAG: dihydrofolate reductase [Thermoanaerobaculia bacterium]|nr:dihydrofolate reductase [Thermoanaerobaculia bacterium]